MVCDGYKFDPQVIEVGKKSYDLGKIVMYNPNYLPDFVLVLMEDNVCHRIEDDEAQEFNRLFNESIKC